MPGFEVLMPLGAIAFYLYDSVLMLYGNDLVLLHGGATWRVSGGAEQLLFGRHPYLPNPLRPDLALFRVAWRPADPRAATENLAELARFEHALRAVRALVWLLLAILLVILPGVALFAGAGVLLLAVFAAYYLLVVSALFVIHSQRSALGLSVKGFWMLAFDVLACAPFAVNLVRRLSLRRSIAGNPLAFAAATLGAEPLAQLVSVVSARVAEDLQQEDLPDGKRAELETFLEQVRGMAPCP